MQWLAVLFFELVKTFSQYFLRRGLKQFAFGFAYIAVTFGLFTALLAGFYQLVALIRLSAPASMSLILSLLPSTTGVFINTYLTALILKRVYDYKKNITEKLTYGGSTDHLR